MSLTSRITLTGPEATSPEDYLSQSLGVIFPGDTVNQHGDAEHSLQYTSPRLPRPLEIELADPEGDADRTLFSHYLWNASLLLAEFIEEDSLGDGESVVREGLGKGLSFDVTGLDVIELGAGTALPSMMASLVGARNVVVTDYPAPAVLKTLHTNITKNITPSHTPLPTPPPTISIHGHSWGSSDLPSPHNTPTHDRVLVADCLWMSNQHANLRTSIAALLRDTPESRAWVVAGFHTGRETVAGFFEEESLRAVGLGVERIWERDVDGMEREWCVERVDGVTERKRWLVVAVLKRV